MKTQNIGKQMKPNVKRVMQQIMERSPVLADLIQQKQIAIAGGMYDLDSGRVNFLE